MKKEFFFAAALLLISSFAIAQPAKKLKQAMELKMAKTADDDMPGTRGAGVVWHPIQKKYYAAFAGNEGYPLCVFDGKGKRISEDELATQFDIRGIWYNATVKAIQVNGYGDYGWGEYKLDKKGIPTEVVSLFEGPNQPDAQSTGTYDIKNKKVYFFTIDGNLEAYSIETAEPTSTIYLNLGKSKKNDETENADVRESYNSNAIYTGIAGSEIALVNLDTETIELYNLKTGYKTKELKLPEGTPVVASFNFAYTNGLYWLFDMEKRTWLGFK